MPHLLFLSHSGIDTESAKALKARILASPAARERELSVWLDKDDLRAGEHWQRQIEEAIARSHAFAIYVGSKGVVNWVEAEVRLALNRALTESDYRFVPIFAGAQPDPETLPGFARQYQGVFDVATRTDQFDYLMRAILGDTKTRAVGLETEPFFGLRVIDESRSHLFFGREKETEALAALTLRRPLVLVIGDSGCGKSSLVRAGLVPRFRGGALALLDGAQPAETIWHVVTMQPRNQPLRQLGAAVNNAAKALGLSLTDRGTLERWATSGEIEEVRRALRCDLPPEHTQILLVVDQFEELLTITPPELRASFVDLLLDLSDPTDGHHRIVLTMRRDYVNLCSSMERLQKCLEADGHCARFSLGGVSPEGLHRVVTEPLRLAGIELDAREALAGEVLRDVGLRPGDLALVQMALTETWRARDQQGDDLLRAYANSGRVEGALAQASERVRQQVLNDEERALLDTIVLRLVRLGDTGGATRRVAYRSEFDKVRWSLVQKLASKDAERLLLLGGSDEQPTVTIAHEALVTAWPYFQNLLQQSATQKSLLDRLINQAQAWAAEEKPKERRKRMATGADLEHFTALIGKHPTWLSDGERKFIKKSKEAADLWRFTLQGIAAVLVIAVAISGWMWWRATEAENIALNEQDKAEESEARAKKAARRALAGELAAYSREALERKDFERALLLSREAILTTRRTDAYVVPQAEAALYQAIEKPFAGMLQGYKEQLRNVAFDRTGTRVLATIGDGTARLWNSQGSLLKTMENDSYARITYSTFNHDGTRIITINSDGTAWLWDHRGNFLKALEGEVTETERRFGIPSSLYATFNHDDSRILVVNEYGMARLWDAQGRLLKVLAKDLEQSTGKHIVMSAAFNLDGSRFLTVKFDGTVHLYNADGKLLTTIEGEIMSVRSAVINHDGTRVLTVQSYGPPRLWDWQGNLLKTLESDGGTVTRATLNHDGTRILTVGGRGANVWDWQGNLLSTFGADGAWFTQVRFNHDGTRILTAGQEGIAHLWDWKGNLVNTLAGHRGPITHAMFNYDSTRILTASTDGTMALWDNNGDLLTRIEAHMGRVAHAMFNQDGTRILTVGDDGTAFLWETKSSLLHILKGHEGPVWATFSHDGDRILTASADGALRIWDNDGNFVGVMQERPKDATLRDTTAPSAPQNVRVMISKPVKQYGVYAAFSHDGNRILTISEAGKVQLWDGDQVLIRQLRGHRGTVHRATFNHDSTLIVTAGQDNTARLWDGEGKPLKILEGHSRVVRHVAFNHDSTRIVTASEDGTARLWDGLGNPLTDLRGHDGPVRYAAFNHDATRVLTASSDFSTRLWDGEGKLLTIMKGHRGAVTHAIFNHDGTRVLTASTDGTARLWDGLGNALQVLRGHGDEVVSAHFNHNGTRLVTASGDGTVRVWNSEGNLLKVAAIGDRRSVVNATFSRDGTRLLAGSSDGSAFLWRIWSRAEAMLSEADRVLVRDFEDEECRQYLHADQCP